MRPSVRHDARWRRLLAARRRTVAVPALARPWPGTPRSRGRRRTPGPRPTARRPAPTIGLQRLAGLGARAPEHAPSRALSLSGRLSRTSATPPSIDTVTRSAVSWWGCFHIALCRKRTGRAGCRSGVFHVGSAASMRPRLLTPCQHRLRLRPTPPVAAVTPPSPVRRRWAAQTITTRLTHGGIRASNLLLGARLGAAFAVSSLPVLLAAAAAATTTRRAAAARPRAARSPTADEDEAPRARRRRHPALRPRGRHQHPVDAAELRVRHLLPHDHADRLRHAHALRRGRHDPALPGRVGRAERRLHRVDDRAPRRACSSTTAPRSTPPPSATTSRATSPASSPARPS